MPGEQGTLAPRDFHQGTHVPRSPGPLPFKDSFMADRSFVHLHCHSHYSLLDGASRIPELVEREQIQSGISIDRSVFHGSRVIGPTLGGYLIKWFGAASAFFANALSFVALIIAILSLPPRRKGTAEEEEKRTSGIKDGFIYVANDKPSLAMVTLIATQAVFIFPIVTVMMPLYVRLVLGLGADRLGFLMGASAVGAVGGSIFLMGLTREIRIPSMMCFSVGIAVAIF